LAIEDKVERAKRAADAVFSDTTVDPATTRALLEDIVEHIQVSIESIDVD